MSRLLVCLLALWTTTSGRAESGFQFRQSGTSGLELTENGKPVFVYIYQPVLKAGTDEKYRRSSYIHPLYAPDGTVVTGDFPKDHPHHRGLCWAWPIVRFEGQTYDMWAVQGMRQRFVQWLKRDAGKRSASVTVENGWFAGDRKIVKETVAIEAMPAADNRRELRLTLTFEAAGEPVEIQGREVKGYGGLHIRFAPRQDTVIHTDQGRLERDSDLTRHPWAQLEGTMEGKRVGVRIDVDPSNPGTPNGWCLRHYGYLGVGWPGLGSYTLRRGEPLALKYRVTVFSKGPASEVSRAGL
ncbi:MAG: PmoA family protein [Bryobacteraceae bacterium]|nr:PmoA family protein [Bryobacterales bacterium]MEB2361227.1 PmoA family protein [Bryobacterales bacterium]NUN01078.1 PmoA family protein [Bryobacteraceae bacterium]